MFPRVRAALIRPELRLAQHGQRRYSPQSQMILSKAVNISPRCPVATQLRWSPAVSLNMNIRIKRLWEKMKSIKYRRAFVTSHLSTTIAAQIQTMREERGWTQRELAKATGMKQSRISVLEDPSNTSLSVNTLRRIAEAFDVALDVRFVSFSSLLKWSVQASENKFSVCSFERDDCAMERTIAPSTLRVINGSKRSRTSDADLQG